MDLLKIKKAEKLIKRIEEIDSLILKMDKMAMTIVNNNHSLSISVECIDLDKPVRVEKEKEFFYPGLLSSIVGGGYHKEMEKTIEPDHSIKFNLKDNECLNIFKYALESLSKEREILLHKIESL